LIGDHRRHHRDAREQPESTTPTIEGHPWALIAQPRRGMMRACVDRQELDEK
jgi:hypothetical protein